MEEENKSLFDVNSKLFWARWEGCELLKSDDGGGPAGVNEGAEEGGGPAGVVEGLEIKNLDFEGWPLAILDRESGVDGGEDENGTTKPDMVEGICVDIPTKADGDPGLVTGRNVSRKCLSMHLLTTS